MPGDLRARTLLLGLLVACGGCRGSEALLPYDATWCSTQANQPDPIAALFDGTAGPDAVVEDYVVGHGYSSGIATAVVGSEGVRFYTKGSTRWGGDVAVDPDTIFEIGSMTKVFTGLLLADAVVRGELRLEDACNDHLPPEARVASSASGAIELWHLATHTSGLPRDLASFKAAPYDSWYENYTVADFYLGLNAVALEAQPGMRSSYSNLGFELLGHLLSLRTGKSYEELLRARVLEPLGMASTYLYQEPAGARLATPYLLRDRETDYFMVPLGLEGAGRIRSSARDMARFLEAALGLRSTPLDAALRLGLQRHFLGPDASGPQGDFGLAWGRGHAAGAVFAAHGGGTWGFTSAIDLDLERRHGTVVLTNSRHDRDCLPSYLAFWLTAWQASQPVGAGVLAEYVGTYRTALGQVAIALKATRLSALPPGASPVNLYPEGNDRFFALAADLQLSFERGADGRISGLAIRTSSDPPFATTQGPQPAGRVVASRLPAGAAQ